MKTDIIKKTLHPSVKFVKGVIDEKKRRKYCASIYSKQMKNFFQSAEKKRCFIIGNGPSLTVNDLDKLIDEDCFGCNRIFGLYSRTKWRPKYYCSQDKKVLQQITGDLQYAVNNCEFALFPYNYRKKIPRDVVSMNNVNWFYKPYVSVYSSDGNYNEGIMPFSNDISERIYDGLSITYAMIQMAVYIGYKEIYLIGIDHNYPKINGIVDNSRSYADGIKPIDMSTQYPPELELCEISFREAKRICDEKGIKIMNVTRGGKLEVFERESFDLLLGKND